MVIKCSKIYFVTIIGTTLIWWYPDHRSNFVKALVVVNSSMVGIGNWSLTLITLRPF